jgi:uncharacterized membrane protein YfcA
MIPAAIAVFVGLIAVSICSLVAALLSFRSVVPTWFLLLAGVPAFAVGAFYSVGLAIAHRGSLPVQAVFWLNTASGLVCLLQVVRRRDATQGAVHDPMANDDEKKA